MSGSEENFIDLFVELYGAFFFHRAVFQPSESLLEYGRPQEISKSQISYEMIEAMSSKTCTHTHTCFQRTGSFREKHSQVK